MNIKTQLQRLAFKSGVIVNKTVSPNTYADVDDLVEEFGYKPSMSVKQGVENFAVWYKEYNEQ